MKVKDVMQKNPLTLNEDSSLKKMVRLMFSTQVSGYPVLRGKKLVGFITAEDLFLDARDHLNDKDSEFLSKLFNRKVKELMTSKVVSVRPDTLLAEANKIMLENYFARLPVVDEGGIFLGTISYSDVFKGTIAKEMPDIEMDEYLSFVLQYYDQIVDWEKRFELEFPTLFRVFAKHNVKKVLDIGFWTGAYAMELAKEGMDVVGVDHNKALVDSALKKIDKLPGKVRKRIDFKLTNYKDLLKQFGEGSFGATLCVGNALVYTPIDSTDLIKSARLLTKKNGVFVLQLLNMERIIEQKRRFYYFKIKPSKKDKEEEELFIEYFDKKDESTVTQNIIRFISSGGRWVYRGINSIEIKYIKNSDVEKMLREAGFKDITITGNKGEEEGEYGHMTLVKPFDPQSSEWMTVFAKA